MSASGSYAPRPSLDDIKIELADRAEELAVALMGPPNRDTARRAEWRWGSHGSAAFVVRNNGSKRQGSFFSHEGSAGGSPLDLVMHARSCGIAEAIRWAEHWLGHDRPDYEPRPVDDAVLAERARKRAEQEAQAAAEAQTKTEYARRLWSERRPVNGSPAGVYLTETRGIAEPACGWPDCMGWHPASRALIFAATADDGTVQAVQRVYLTAAGVKIGDAELEERRLPAGKQTNGPPNGAAVRLPGLSDGPLLLCEGPETGLSAFVATGRETWIALGKIAKLTPPTGRVIIVCRDDDRKKKPGDRGRSNDDLHREMMGAWRKQGLAVVDVLPWSDRRFDGSDFNDLLRAEGLDATAKQIEAAIPPDLPSEFSMPTLTLEEARKVLHAPIDAFFGQALSWSENAKALLERQRQAKRDLEELHGETANRELSDVETAEQADIQAIIDLRLPSAFHAGLKVGLGVGKTHSTAEAVGRYVKRAHLVGLPENVLWTSPTLDLADQTATMLRMHGLKVGIYRGREAKDPNGKAIDGDDLSGKMCIDLPAVHAALEAGENVSTTVCGVERGDAPLCSRFDECPFQQNNKALRHADVVMAAHTSLFHALPERVEKLIGLTVIDEAFWQQGLHTVEIAMNSLVDDVKSAPVLDSQTGEEESFVTERLLATMEEVRLVLEGAADGVPLTDLGGLNFERCRDAAKEHWRRRVEIEMYPGMPLEERKEAARRAATNKRIPRMAMLMRTLADILEGTATATGRLEMFTDDLKAGPIRKVLVHQRRPLREARLTRPILHLDGTMPVEAVCQYIPQMEVVADVSAIMPNMTTIQVLSTRYNRGGWGKNSVCSSDKLPPDEIQRRENRIECLKDFLRGQVLQHGHGLAVTYQVLEEQLQGIKGLALAHFNAVAGINRHENVNFEVVIGRPMPSPYDTAQLVKQLFGTWCEPDAPQERHAGLLMADGSRRTILTRRFDNPEMEAIRRAIADDNVSQAVGRVRGVRRGTGDPVLVLLLSDCVTGFPLAGVTDWQTIQPDRIERMAARGVVIRSPADAAKVYPDLFSSRDAAKAAFAAGARTTGGIPSIIVILGDPPVVRRVIKIRYRPAPTPSEPNPKSRLCDVTDVSRLDGMKAWLTEIIGPLALFEIVTPEPEPTTTAMSPLHLVRDIEELDVPTPRTIAANFSPPDRMCPAAIYPPADEFGWVMLLPVVDLYRVAGRRKVISLHPGGSVSTRERLFGAEPFTVPARFTASNDAALGQVHPMSRSA